MNDLLQSSSQQTWLWIGTIGMALGAILIYALGAKGSHHHRVASVFVCAIAACMYLLMAFGQGDVIITQDNWFLTPDGVLDIETASLVYWARYLDWVFTTPLLLIGLLTLGLRAVTGGGEAVRDRLGLVAGVVGADVMDFHGGPVVIHLHALKTHPDIGLDVLNEMAQMYGAIGIGQCGGDEDATMRHGCDRVKEGSE